MKGVKWVGFLAAVVAALPSTALANPEPPAIYDARVLGLGGAIGPLVDGPAAVYHNPAGLGHIDKFELNVTFAPFWVNLEAPHAGAGTERETGWITAPLAFLGAGFRVHERITLGAGFYLSTAFGGRFDGVPQVGDCSLPEPDQMTCSDPDDTDFPADQSVTFLILEAAVPIAINVTEDLRIGLALRVPYGIQTTDTVSQVFGSYARVEQDVSGFGTPGINFGVQWDAHEQLSLSFGYRSKVRVHMEGEAVTQLGGAITAGLSTNWYVPHAFRLGAAWRPLDDRLRIVAETRLQLHKEANERQVFDTDVTIPGFEQIVIPFDWRNVWVFSAGAEFDITERWPVRLGFSRANSATPRSTVTPFTPPPDTPLGFYIGSGYHARTWVIDAALGFAGGGDQTIISTPGPLCSDPMLATPSGCDGQYRTSTIFSAITFEYTLGGNDFSLSERQAQRRAREAGEEPEASEAPPVDEPTWDEGAAPADESTTVSPTPDPAAGAPADDTTVAPAP